MINELIEQIGRDRIQELAHTSYTYRCTPTEQMVMARALLAVLDAKPVAYRFRKVGTTKWKYSDVENYFQEDSGTEEDQPLHITPPAASEPVSNGYTLPDGYHLKLIPVEGTDAFRAACTVAYEEFNRGTGPCGVFIAGHRAMIAAAPAPGGK